MQYLLRASGSAISGVGYIFIQYCYRMQGPIQDSAAIRPQLPAVSDIVKILQHKMCMQEYKAGKVKE
jgi:hypothetical protein